jgi:phytoene desaturase
MRRKHAAVIGGGLGGIAIALRLAARGWSVTLFERGARLGGKMGLWERDGFRFDTGPTLITMPSVFAELFEIAGLSFAREVPLVPTHPHATYVFPDGARIVVSSELPEWLVTLRRLGAREADGYLRFLELGARLLAVSRGTFLRQPPLAPLDREGLRAIRHMPLRLGWGNYHRTVERLFGSSRLRMIFDRYPTYVGSSPFLCPATFLVIPYLEQAHGCWFVRGGLYTLVEQLGTALRALGVRVRTGSTVTRIEHDQHRVRGVVLEGGERTEADVVVMNGDASNAPALLGLADESGLPFAERSMSGVVFLIGLKRTHDELSHHTVYFTRDYAREFDQIFRERRFPDDPTVYVNVASRTDRSAVPTTGEAVFLMANAPADEDADWGEAAVARARASVFATLRRGGFPDIENEVACESVWTPGMMAERFLAPGGAIYGTHSHGYRKAFLRPPNRDPRMRGLYFVGGSTHPGGGTPTVLLSAAITARLIERHERD